MRRALAAAIALSLAAPSFANADDSVSWYQGARRVFYVTGADFASSSMFIGTGGAFLAHTTGLEGYYNTCAGLRCLTNITTGSYNTGGGFETMENCTTCTWNTAFGEAALIYNVTGNGNTALGWKAGLGSAPGNPYGSYNVWVGFGSGLNAVGGSNNIAVGPNTLASANFSGSNNIAIGNGAGAGLTTGSGNTIIGTPGTLPAGLTNNLIIGDGVGNTHIQYDPTTGWTFNPPLPSGGSPNVWQSGVQSCHTGDTAEATLATITIPGNTLGANGMLRITPTWSHSGGAGSWGTRIYFGGVLFQQFPLNAAAYQAATHQADIFNRGAAGSQVGRALAQANWAQTPTAPVTASIDTTAAQNVTITGQNAASGDTVCLEAYTVQVIKP